MADVNDDSFHRRIGTGGKRAPLEIITHGRQRFLIGHSDEPAILGKPVDNTPSAPGLQGSGVFFFRDRGDGKAQLCVVFPSGAVQIIATEP